VSSRIASQHLALAFDSQIRLVWRTMQEARQRDCAGDAFYLKNYLNTLLEVRKIARRDYVSLENPSRAAFRRDQAEADDIRADDNRAYLADQTAGVRRIMGLMG
jgi:hypothetical protein